ncbi:MAG TPA: bifunctional YncE family protein/alkaline phosphatase family protein [Acidimicrobiales bacterium]|nr:bifunctional YncE family protein/alkaline phosphatase family protein [Acidimicrobiales bacterium]
MRGSPRIAAVTALVAAAGLGVAGVASAAMGTSGRVGPAFSLTPSGRHLVPDGRMTTVGDYPTGGALSPDGRFYWAVDSGHGQDDVRVLDVSSGGVQQVLPLPGAYGGIVYAPDGRTVYVSGEPKGDSHPGGTTVADGGDAIHVFSVDPASGHAVERPPIPLPATSGGSAQKEGANPLSLIYEPPGPGPSSGLGWPIGLGLTADGRSLVVALNQADQVAVVDLATRSSRLVKVGSYPYGVAVVGSTAYVSNEYDGTVSVVDVGSATVTRTITVGVTNSHPEGLIADPARHALYVAVTNQDYVAVVDTRTGTVAHRVSVRRKEGVGTAPVALAEAPDGSRLYVADAGEDAVSVISLRPRNRAGAFQLLGRIPTASYTTAVAVTPDGRRVVWLAAKGLGAGPNPLYGQYFANSDAAPYGQYVIDMLLGRVGVLAAPSDAALSRLGREVTAEIRPTDLSPGPANTPVEAPGGGPSRQIKHVFLVVKENRTYDQIFGSDKRGDGDPALELFDDNGAKGPAGGVTPNAHRLARQFPLLDHFYADSEVSVDGHIVTSGAYATDFVLKALHPNYSNRGRIANFGQDPVTFPPDDFIFDQAARQGVSFRNYGEYSAGDLPQGDDGRPTYRSVQANTAWGYPIFFGCDNFGIAPNGLNNSAVCDQDSGSIGPAGQLDTARSRFDFFQTSFDEEIATNTVPALTYLTLPNDHTNGVQMNYPTPKAMVADNDLGLGQLVQLLSHSPIWSQSAIFVEEDDSQDGADHVDAHRMPAFVISPWARHGAVVHTRYDQESMLRTVELMLGLKPLSLYDGLAEPMYDAFVAGDAKPDLTPYTAVTPTQPLTELTTTPPTGLAAALPYNDVDLVPQQLFDQVLWQSVYGTRSHPPGPGPNASPAEADRAKGAVTAYRRHDNVTSWLMDHTTGAPG